MKVAIINSIDIHSFLNDRPVDHWAAKVKKENYILHCLNDAHTDPCKIFNNVLFEASLIISHFLNNQI